MSLKLEILCSNHQRNDGGYGKEEEIYIDNMDEKARQEVVTYLVKKRWVVQFNGNHMDTYCSKKCAE